VISSGCSTRLLDVHGRLVTGDAAQCQRETAQVILDAKAD
jgi:predicted transposase YbfD/YdcC